MSIVQMRRGGGGAGGSLAPGADDKRRGMHTGPPAARVSGGSLSHRKRTVLLATQLPGGQKRHQRVTSRFGSTLCEAQRAFQVRICDGKWRTCDEDLWRTAK